MLMKRAPGIIIKYNKMFADKKRYLITVCDIRR